MHEELLIGREVAQEVIRQTHDENKLKQAMQHDKHIEPVILQVGSWVKYEKQPHKKMDPRWTGPWCIAEVRGPDLRLVDEAGKPFCPKKRGSSEWTHISQVVPVESPVQTPKPVPQPAPEPERLPASSTQSTTAPALDQAAPSEPLPSHRPVKGQCVIARQSIARCDTLSLLKGRESVT